MTFAARLTAALLILALAGPAFAVGVTGHLDDVRDEMEARRAELAGQVRDKATKKAMKRFEKGLRLLGKSKIEKSYRHEMKFAAKIAKIAEKKLPGETTLMALLEAARDAYRSDLTQARETLAQLAAVPGLGKKPRKKRAKDLKKADRAFAKADAADRLSKELKKLSKAARRLDELIGQDPGAGLDAAWVVSALQAAPAGQGLDLDGDGTKDNVIGGLGSLLAQIDPSLDIATILEEQLANSPTVVLIRMWGVDSWAGDPLVHAGLANGVDLDGDPSDNFSGSETFDASAGTAADGYPLLRTVTSLSSAGGYSVAYTGSTLDIAGVTIDANALVRVEGTATPAANDGVIGFAIPVDTVLQLIEDEGFTIPPLVQAFLPPADIDADGDGTVESWSGALLFESVPALIQ